MNSFVCRFVSSVNMIIGVIINGGFKEVRVQLSFNWFKLI